MTSIFEDSKPLECWGYRGRLQHTGSADCWHHSESLVQFSAVRDPVFQDYGGYGLFLAGAQQIGLGIALELLDRFFQNPVRDANVPRIRSSVIKESKRGQSKHYGEWKAEKDGKSTYRSMVKAEIDQAIQESITTITGIGSVFAATILSEIGDITRFESSTKLAAFHDPAIMALYQRKRAEGKHHMTAIGHVCRKMVSIIFAVLRDIKPYVPHISV